MQKLLFLSWEIYIQSRHKGPLSALVYDLDFCCTSFKLLYCCTCTLIQLMLLFFALLCQRVWRRYSVIRIVSEQLHEEWEALINQPDINLTKQWISSMMLRPFLFFVTQPSSWYKGQQDKTLNSISACFKIILNSINSMGMPFS